MPKEKNILVDRGIPMKPQIIGNNYVVGSTNSPSGRASAMDYIGRKVVTQFEACLLYTSDAADEAFVGSVRCV